MLVSSVNNIGTVLSFTVLGKSLIYIRKVIMMRVK